MLLTRFERKILLAISVVALAPLIAAVVLGSAALREAYQVGVNPQIHQQLERGLEVYRDYLVALRRDAEHTADAVAFHTRVHESVAAGAHAELEEHLRESLETYPNLAAAQVTAPSGRVLARVERAALLDTERFKQLTQTRDLSGDGVEGYAVELTLAAPAEPFREFDHAAVVEQTYAQLRESTGYISTLYLVLYVALLLSVIVIAMAAAFVLSRRVTRRVVDLADATQRVGAGDLTVRVPTGADDEIGELTDAFNSMVRDMRESRQRIDYLQRISAWQEFARRLAHEIKNPLTPIQLAVQEIQQSYGGDDQAHRARLEEARSIVEEEVATLRRLVGEFSAFAKLPEAHLEEADLREFLGDVERTTPAILEDLDMDAEVWVRCETEHAIPVEIDGMMLKRCVDNLVRNAIQALRGAPEPRQVVVAARREGDLAVIEVRDSGPGVPRRDRGRVFDPYFTTKSDGTGLGLAIVKKVVLEHGGRIECDVAPEGGACFRVRLPILGTTRRGTSGSLSSSGTVR